MFMTAKEAFEKHMQDRKDRQAIKEKQLEREYFGFKNNRMAVRHKNRLIGEKWSRH